MQEELKGKVNTITHSKNCKKYMQLDTQPKWVKTTQCQNIHSTRMSRKEQQNTVTTQKKRSTKRNKNSWYTSPKDLYTSPNEPSQPKKSQTLALLANTAKRTRKLGKPAAVLLGSHIMVIKHCAQLDKAFIPELAKMHPFQIFFYSFSSSGGCIPVS